MTGGPTHLTENQPGRQADRARPWPPRWAEFYRNAVFSVLLCFAMAPAASAKVVLLVERGASIYQQAALGFQQAFSGTDQVEQIYTDADSGTLGKSFDSLRRNPPRLVVAIGTQAARTAKERLPDSIPLLYCLVLRPVQNKLVGTNIGGIALDIEFSQQLESIKKVLPKLHRLGLVFDELTSGPLVSQLRQHLGTNVQLVARDVRTPQEAAREIQDLLGNVLSGEDAFYMLWDAVSANPANFKLLVELSLKNKVPIIAPARPFVEAGALISVGADYKQAGRQAALMAQQILRNESRPEDFGAVPPADAVVTINGEVARRLGIELPPDLRADILAPAVGVRAP
jgi:putative ABC transport system substrate-binding protein